MPSCTPCSRSEAGYRVGEVAPRGVQRRGSEDLVIASVHMPKHVGVQLLREAQAAHPCTTADRDLGAGRGSCELHSGAAAGSVTRAITVRPNVQFIQVPGGVNAPADLVVFRAHLSVQF